MEQEGRSCVLEYYKADKYTKSCVSSFNTQDFLLFETWATHLSLRITNLRNFKWHSCPKNIKKMCGVFLPKLSTHLNHSLHQLLAISKVWSQGRRILLRWFFSHPNSKHSLFYFLLPFLSPPSAKSHWTFNPTKKPSNSQFITAHTEWKKPHTPKYKVSRR